MTNEELEQIAEMVATKLKEGMAIELLFLSIAEHEATGGGKVLYPERAAASPCTCFDYAGDKYGWSPGVMGLISSKKTPAQFDKYCPSCEPAPKGTQERFETFKTAIERAHQKWEATGGGLPEWWEAVGQELRTHRIVV